MHHKDIHIIKGKKPILISAPHTRPIKIEDHPTPYLKLPENKVTKLLKSLCEKSESWGVLTAGKGTIHNWEQELSGVYKKHIHEIISKNNIALFVEIHGSLPSRPFTLDYDFMIPNIHPHDIIVEKTISYKFKKYFPKKTISNGFFRKINGTGEKTFTYFVRDTFKIPAVQLEINKTARSDEKYLTQTENMLHEIITDYHNENIVD